MCLLLYITVDSFEKTSINACGYQHAVRIRSYYALGYEYVIFPIMPLADLSDVVILPFMYDINKLSIFLNMLLTQGLIVGRPHDYTQLLDHI